jgi:ferritin-like protein
MADATFHEPPELLTAATRDLHRALRSLIEELEAVDWYQQRAEACADAELRAVILHNRDEEVEHALMSLEWIRRRDPVFDRQVRAQLFKSGPIAAELPGQDEPSHPTAPAAGALETLAIGSLRPSAT